MKQLERLLLFQGNRCFFCREPIPEGEASIEHLVAVARGGLSDDDNCVVCCKALNVALGNRPFKEKLRAILSHRPRFTCPRPAGSNGLVPAASTLPAKIAQQKVELIIEHMKKQRNGRPRKLATLRNAIASLFQKQLKEGDLNGLLADLVAGKHISIDGEKVTYHFPAQPPPPPAKRPVRGSRVTKRIED